MGICFNSFIENSYITLDDTLNTINKQFINIKKIYNGGVV